MKHLTLCLKCIGANVIVAASAIFGSNDKKGVIDALRQSVVTCGNGN